MSLEKQSAPFWQRFDINQLEDLGNAVLGAELEVVQMSGPPARGSLAFAACDGVIFSSGLIKGRVAVRGLLCRDAITLGVGLRFGPGSRLFLNPATDGDVGVFLPGEACDVLFGEGSLYLAANLTEETLREEAARGDIALDHRLTSRTGLHSRLIAPQALVQLQDEVARLHRFPDTRGDGIGRAVVRAVIEHYARSPTEGCGRIDPVGLARIVHRTREFIHANLAQPIALDTLASAAETSRRTLARAFLEVLDDTPGNYVRRLRLHNIRRDLVRGEACGRTIHEIAAACGIREAGRMAGWYRGLFGEFPHETVSVYERRRRQEAVV